MGHPRRADEKGPRPCVSVTLAEAKPAAKLAFSSVGGHGADFPSALERWRRSTGMASGTDEEVGPGPFTAPSPHDTKDAVPSGEPQGTQWTLRTASDVDFRAQREFEGSPETLQNGTRNAQVRSSNLLAGSSQASDQALRMERPPESLVLTAPVRPGCARPVLRHD